MTLDEALGCVRDAQRRVVLSSRDRTAVINAAAVLADHVERQEKLAARMRRRLVRVLGRIDTVLEGNDD